MTVSLRKFRPASHLIAAMASACFLLAPPPADAAACGLHCLRAQAVEASGFLELGASLRRSAIEYAGAPGAWSEIGLELRYRSRDRWAAGLQWPMAMLDYGGVTRNGMGNPMGFAEYRITPSESFHLDLGSQLSIPLGNVGDGLASDRFMGALYAALTRAEGSFEWSAAMGMSAMLPAMDPGHVHGGEGGSVVPAGVAIGSPHENLELLYRLGAKKKLWDDRTALSLILDGQHVLGAPMDPQSGRDFLTMETGASIFIGKAVLSPALLTPVSADRRLDWGLVLRVAVAY